MVTFSNAGRYGNWFFEICTAIAYSLDNNLEFHAPDGKGKDPYHCPTYCHHLCNPRWNPSLEKIHLWENGHHYQELPFKEEWRDKNIIIEGYRQSEKYFAHRRDEILYLLNYPYKKRSGYVSVHVRRGDYLHLRNKHPEVTKEWYVKAMSHFEGEYEFIFYSDDIEWCKKEFGHRSDCQFSEGNSIEFDAYDAAFCEHNIISASTFGWAQAWLNRNPNKKVLIPKLWFVEGYDLDTSDIIPDWMTKI